MVLLCCFGSLLRLWVYRLFVGCDDCFGFEVGVCYLVCGVGLTALRFVFSLLVGCFRCFRYLFGCILSGLFVVCGFYDVGG